MEEAQNILILKSALILQLQLAEEEKKNIVDAYKINNYDLFKKKFLEVNNKIQELNEELKLLNK